MSNEMIRRLEVVSSHFSYTEEYVWNKSIAWVNRKFEQALKEQHELYAQNANSMTSSVYMSVMAVMSQAFGGGKDSIDLNDMMVKSYDETIKDQRKAEDVKETDSGGKFKTSFIERARAAQMKQEQG